MSGIKQGSAIDLSGLHDHYDLVIVGGGLVCGAMAPAYCRSGRVV